MKKLILSTLLSAAALSATPTGTAVLVSVPANAPVINGVPVSPYTIDVNGVSFEALCIDPDHFSATGQDYTAYISSPSGDISNTYHPTSATQYAEEAYIYQEITTPGIDSQTQIDLQEAAWQIINPNYSTEYPGFGPDSAALGDVAAAEANYASVDLTNFAIITDTAGTQQEFMVDPVPTPEPASCALLGGGLFLLGGAIRFARRQQTAKV